MISPGTTGIKGFEREQGGCNIPIAFLRGRCAKWGFRAVNLPGQSPEPTSVHPKDTNPPLLVGQASLQLFQRANPDAQTSRWPVAGEHHCVSRVWTSFEYFCGNKTWKSCWQQQGSCVLLFKHPCASAPNSPDHLLNS